jgi:hypothetical protein
MSGDLRATMIALTIATGSPSIAVPALVSMQPAAMRLAWRRFRQHRDNSRRRTIPFLLSFPSWLSIWWMSGHWHERGIRRGQFVMARPEDCGSYVGGNVAIITNAANVVEAFGGKPHTAAWLATARKACKRRSKTSWLANTTAANRAPAKRQAQREMAARKREAAA